MPSNPDEVRDNALRAIESLTAWAGSENSNDFLAERYAAMASEEGREGVVRSWAGAINVASYMLVWLSKLTGKSEEEILQMIALHYQGLE